MSQKPKNYCLTEGRILSENELKKMLKMIRPHKELSVQTKKNIHFINDFYLILFGSLTGLRVSEIAGLKIADIGESSLRVIGKGNRLRSIPIGRRGRSVIDELLKLKIEVLNQSTEPKQCLFLNRSGRPFNRFAIERRFTFWKQRCGITRRLNYHGLRHYFATYLLNNGFLLHEVSRFLGHSSPSTTAQYLHFTVQTQERVDSVL